MATQPQQYSAETAQRAPEQPQHAEASKQPQELEPMVEFAEKRDIETTTEEGFLDESIDAIKQRLKKKKVKPTDIPQLRDDTVVHIEKIMESGLEEAYEALTPVQKQEFKLKGEQVAIQIRTMLKKTHVRAKKIFDLLFQWLKMLPGVSRFFLEQEAKIKTDKILSIKKRP